MAVLGTTQPAWLVVGRTAAIVSAERRSQRACSVPASVSEGGLPPLFVRSAVRRQAMDAGNRGPGTVRARDALRLSPKYRGLTRVEDPAIARPLRENASSQHFFKHPHSNPKSQGSRKRLTILSTVSMSSSLVRSRILMTSFNMALRSAGAGVGVGGGGSGGFVDR